MKNRIHAALLGAACVLATISSAGCGEHSCPAVARFSMIELTLHLPPEQDVAMPETLRVCQEPKCATATLPPLTDTGAGFSFGPFFADDGTFVFAPSTPSGDSSVAPGGVRLLTVLWPLVEDDAFNPKDPRNFYIVDVRDANGVQTGKISAEIMYTHVTDEECGVDYWSGALSD